MINPYEVLYDGIKDMKILFISETNSYSIASLTWKGKQKLAFRWNGNESEDSLGTPTANGKATWMFLPEDFLEQLGAVLDRIRKGE